MSLLLQESSVCSDYFFKCPNGQCIRYDGRCNGYAECGDGSDEANCGMEIIYSHYNTMCHVLNKDFYELIMC